ncbi:MAG: hypothetical protein ACQERI_04960 [Candidatus Krumholzibacteriota bacterium]
MLRFNILAVLLILTAVIAVDACSQELDPFRIKQIFEPFPNVQVVPLDNGNAWGMMYADVYGKIYLKRATENGWKREWELTSLGSKIKRFFVLDLDGNGIIEIVVATTGGKILIYEMESYSNVWENVEMDFKEITAIEIANVDDDPQYEFIVLADNTITIIDGLNKNQQWISGREFKADEMLVDNVDEDEQKEIVLNTGIVIDSKFYNVELEWHKAFGERIIAYDINNDGIKDIIGEFSDYSIRVFDVKARREVW